MTGSPVTKNPLDLYSQCEFFKSWLLNFASYYSFRNRYAEMKTINVHAWKTNTSCSLVLKI